MLRRAAGRTGDLFPQFSFAPFEAPAPENIPAALRARPVSPICFMRPHLLLAALLPLACLSMFAAPAPDQRVLIISAPSLTDDAYRTQAALLLPAWAGLLERDFTVQTRFDAPAFSVALIGKDGGEKLRRTTSLAPAELFALVDAMPLRRAEMRERK